MKKVLRKVGKKLENDPFDMKISDLGIWKVLVSNKRANKTYLDLRNKKLVT